MRATVPASSLSALVQELCQCTHGRRSSVYRSYALVTYPQSHTSVKQNGQLQLELAVLEILFRPPLGFIIGQRWLRCQHPTAPSPALQRNSELVVM
jgi:hypothetical protein